MDWICIRILHLNSDSDSTFGFRILIRILILNQNRIQIQNIVNVNRKISVIIKSFCELDYKDFSRLREALCEKAWVKEHLCIPDIWPFYGLTYGSMGLNCKPQADRGRGAILSPLRHKHYASVIQPIRTLQGDVKTCQNTWVLRKPVIWLMGFYKNSLWNGIFVSCLKFKFPFVKTGLLNVACLIYTSHSFWPRAWPQKVE